MYIFPSIRLFTTNFQRGVFRLYSVSHSLPNFFNNSNTNEYIATKFEQEYVQCVRNEEECVCSVCLFRYNFFIGVRIIK